MAAAASVYEIDTRLHRARKSKEILKLLSSDSLLNVNAQTAEGDTPLHCFIREGAYDCLLTLLSHCEPNRLDLDAPGEFLNTPLHLAAQLNNIDGAKALIAFGADIDALNFDKRTPLDIARDRNHQELSELLFFVGSELGHAVCERLDNFYFLPPAPVVNSSEDNDERDIRWRELSQSTEVDRLSRRLSSSAEHGYTAWLEWRKKRQKLNEDRRSEQHRHTVPPIFKAHSGERVLSLDGGALRGLIQVEVMSFIAKATGRKIHELFDWVVATSTGGILALGLIYGQYDIPTLRKFAFEIKDKVFSKARLGIGCDTEALEQALKREYGDRTMDELPNGPKVLISAVSKKTDKLELCWFNNCFHDKFYGFPLWYVARCTSAAPCFFTPMDDFIDGGVKANNPSESALTIIQEHLRRTSGVHRPMKVSLVVSVGCGKFPGEKLGDTDIEKYLFLGKHLLHPKKALDDIRNLTRLMISAIDNSEEAAKNTRSRCQEQGVAYYRFNPSFDENISLTETDNRVLCQMVINARIHIFSQIVQMEEIIEQFYLQ